MEGCCKAIVIRHSKPVCISFLVLANDEFFVIGCDERLQEERKCCYICTIQYKYQVHLRRAA